MKKELQNKIETSKIFTRFKKIPDKAFHDFYFFYQFYLPQITALEFEEYIEIKFNYIQALFFLDKYHQFYIQAEDLLAELLNYHTFEERPKKIYEKILYYKAEALRNESNLKASQKTYTELFKINPGNKIYQRKLFYLLFQNEQVRNRKNVALVVLLILMSLICTAASVFVVQPFFEEWSKLIIQSRNVFFASGILGFLILQALHFLSAIQALRRLDNK